MIVGLLSLILLSSDPAATAPPVAAAPAPAATPAPAAKPVKEKKICKVEDADSGSHMARRICLTQDEWAHRGQGMMNNSRSGFTGAADNH